MKTSGSKPDSVGVGWWADLGVEKALQPEDSRRAEGAPSKAGCGSRLTLRPGYSRFRHEDEASLQLQHGRC